MEDITIIEPKSVSLEMIFEILQKKMLGYIRPVSIAELRLEESFIHWLRQWFSNVRGEVRNWLHSDNRVLINGSQYTKKGMFGFLLVVISSELCRSESSEDMIWPIIKNLFSEEDGLRKYLFPGGQPSSECKSAISMGVKEMVLRNAIEFEGTQEYFDTVKMQFGFTFMGAKRRLPYWLAGYGLPVAIKLLSGESEYEGVESKTFRELWKSLKQFAKGEISETDIRQMLKDTCWIKEGWQDEIVKQAKRVVSYEVQKGIVESGTLDGPIERIGLMCDKVQKPRLYITVIEETVIKAASETQSTNIAFEINGKVVERWIKQSDGSWKGKRNVFCEPESMNRQPNLAPSVMRILAEDSVLFDVDFGEYGILEDVVLFEETTGNMISGENILNKNKNYYVLYDSDLEFSIKTTTVYQCNNRKISFIKSPMPEDLSLYLGNMVYWQPEFSESTRIYVPAIIVENEGSNIPIMGQKICLRIVGVGDDVVSAELVLAAKKYELEKYNNYWKTKENIAMNAKILSKRERMKVSAKYTDGRTRIHKTNNKLRAIGIAILSDPDKTNGEYEWREIYPAQHLNIANHKTQCRMFFSDDGKGVIYEGYKPISRIRRNILKGYELGGWGARLIYKDANTYNNLNQAVVDKGIIKLCIPKSFFNAKPLIQLDRPIELNEDHKIIHVVKEAPCRLKLVESEVESQVDEYMYKWYFQPVKNCIALALSYHGNNLGTYIHDDKAMAHSYGPTIEHFALLRWLKVPVLSDVYRTYHNDCIYRRPIDYLRAWYLNEGLNPEFCQYGEKNDLQWRESVIRDCMWDWMPRYENSAYQVANVFGGSGNREVLLKTIANIGCVIPPLMLGVIIQLNITENERTYICNQILGITNANDIFRELSMHEWNVTRAFGYNREHINKCIADMGNHIINENMRVPLEITKTNRCMAENNSGRRMMSVKLLLQTSKNA